MGCPNSALKNVKATMFPFLKTFTSSHRVSTVGFFDIVGTYNNFLHYHCKYRVVKNEYLDFFHT